MSGCIILKQIDEQLDNKMHIMQSGKLLQRPSWLGWLARHLEPYCPLQTLLRDEFLYPYKLWTGSTFGSWRRRWVSPIPMGPPSV